MAVVDYVDGLEPTPILLEGTVALAQEESQAYNRLDKYEQAAIKDLRKDVDDAVARIMANYMGDRDATAVDAMLPVGVGVAGSAIDPASDDQDIIFGVSTGAEADRSDPAFAALTVGLINSGVAFTSRHPGNGTPTFPMGNRDIMIYEAELDDQALSFEAAIVEIDGRNYRVFVVHLETIATVIQTTAQEIINACTFNHVDEDEAFSLYLSSTDLDGAGGTGDGTGVVAATTELEQFAGGEGGLYFAIHAATIARVEDWDLGASQVTLNFDGTAVVGTILNVGFVTGGLLTWIAIPLLAGGGTISEEVEPASVQVFKTLIDHTDLSAAALSEAISLAAGFPADAIPLTALVEVVTPFSGGGSSAVAAEVGDAGDVDEYCTSQGIFTGVSVGKYGAPGALSGTMTFETGYVPICTITSDVNVALLDAGEMVIHIFCIAP